MKVRDQTGRSAFTLVELLVVVGIIAVLISVLIPVLGKVRESGKTTVCMNQLRQLGEASMMYTVANEGLLFPSTAFYNSLSPFIAKPSLVSGSQYAESYRSCYVCPKGLYGSSSQTPLAYGANTSVHTYMSGTRVQKRLSAMHRPTELISMMDTAQASGVYTVAGWIDNSDAGTVTIRSNSNQPIDNLFSFINTDTGNGYHPRYRHGGQTTACAVFLDGHVEIAPMRFWLYRNYTNVY